MKRACILVHPDFLGDICKQSEEKIWSVDSPIPQDAKFVGAEYSFIRGAFIVSFEHDSFEDIPKCVEMPILECPIFKIRYVEDI